MLSALQSRAFLIRESIFSSCWATTIVSLWLITAYIALFRLPDAAELPYYGVILLIVSRSFLHTGLFILAHDAMHGTLIPASEKINNAVGQLILGIYGFLSFRQMQQCHHQHHRTPARLSDPDFYPGDFWAWYLSFMRVYIKGGQAWVIFWGMSLFFYPMVCFLHVPLINAVLFWLLPMLLSSWQLFYFGTYRPHKQPAAGHTNAHRANSSNASPLVSFLSCYHFDYHWEHHQYPHLPWYRLPSARFR